MDFGIFEEAGIGGVILTIYFFFIIELFSFQFGNRAQALLSIAPVVVMIVLIDSFNDPIIERIAGKNFLENVHQELRDELGKEEFYYDYEEKQDKIDELDRKSVGKVITIIAGVLIVASLPIVGFYYAGKMGTVISALVDIPVFYVLVHQQRKRLRKIIKELLRLYD